MEEIRGDAEAGLETERREVRRFLQDTPAFVSLLYRFFSTFLIVLPHWYMVCGRPGSRETRERPLTHAGHGKRSGFGVGPRLTLGTRKGRLWKSCCDPSFDSCGVAELLSCGVANTEFHSKPARTGRRENARYGLRARRVGEASHPGPGRSLRLFRLLISMVIPIIAVCAASCDLQHAQSHRSKPMRLHLRQDAKKRQGERAAFETQTSLGSQRLVWSRGTCKLLELPRRTRPSTISIKILPRRPHTEARYGLRARRIGEASNPGPMFVRRAQVRESLWSVHLAGLPSRRYSEAEVASITYPCEQAQKAARVLTALAVRTRKADTSMGNVPVCVQRQQWSEFNVPLMWAAAAGAERHPIIEWLKVVTATANPAVIGADAPRSVPESIEEGWQALRSRFRSWGISSHEEFIAWMRAHRFREVAPESHFSKSCQEYVLDRAVEEDISVANWEIGLVSAALHLSEQPQLTFATQVNIGSRTAPRQRRGTVSAGVNLAHVQTHGDIEAGTVVNDATESARPPASSWEHMAALSLEAELRRPVRTVREPPRWFRGSLRKAFAFALRSRETNRRTAPAWKLFVLTSRMLLAPTEAKGDAGKAIFFERFRRFMRGDWQQLLDEAADGCDSSRSRRELDEEQARERRRDEAERRIAIREVSRARTLLTSSGIAPGTQETLDELSNEDLRPIELSQDLPTAAMQHQPLEQLDLDPKLLLQALRSAGRGSAPDLAGMRYEHLRVMADEERDWALVSELAHDFARAKVPEEVMQALRLGRMTALKKDNGKIRGIVAGSILRRLVCKTVAMQFSDHFLERTSPFQFALQTKAGTDALAHTLRLVTDSDPDTVVVSLDGVGAFDHVRRAAFFEKLMSCEELRELLPLVRALYGSLSRFVWTDDKGEQHVIEQAEGGEQGCPLMPALYALAQHDALVRASENLLPSERILSFLDDLYVVTCRARAYEAFDEVARQVEEHAGVQTHLGKLRAWCSGGGPPPADLAAECPDAWTADKPDEANGIVVLGTPLGRKTFVEAHARERIQKEHRLLDELPLFKDPQAAWVLLVHSAAQRANHTIRVVPPSLSSSYAADHDEAMWAAFCAILGAEDFSSDSTAKSVSTMPARLGGLGLRSAARTAQAAYWASWMDALPVLAAKCPDLAASAVRDLSHEDGPSAACLQEANDARNQLITLGTQGVPTWAEAVAGPEPPQRSNSEDDDDDFDRGWQSYATSAHETNFAESVVKPICDGPRRALMLSQGGSGGAWLRAIPSEAVFQMRAARFQVALRRRLRWALPLAQGICRGRSCKRQLDQKGDHAASCAISGLLKLRSRPFEKVWVRILREAGIRIRENVLLRDTGVEVDPADRRNIEIVATGLPMEHGIPVAVDATMVSPLHADGSIYDRADSVPGIALHRARRAKAETYPELAASPQLRLLTVAIETGGRMNGEARALLKTLAAQRAESEPLAMRSAIARSFRRRWLTMASVVAQDSLAATLLDDGVGLLDVPVESSPLGVHMWLDDR